MIRLYCQYNHTGFKKFYFEGLAEEPIGRENEVNLANTHAFPDDANTFVQFDDAKMLYRSLPDGQLFLGIREIPSNKTDSDGRRTACAALFVGEEQDRKTLDNLALDISNDIGTFEQFFADLFYIRQGLRVHGDKLMEYIRQHESVASVEGTSHPVLMSIQKKRSGIFLFVPFSSKFGSDRDVTNKVCSNFGINKADLKDVVISQLELSRVQNRLHLAWAQPTNVSPLITQDDAHDSGKVETDEAEKSIRMETGNPHATAVDAVAAATPATTSATKQEDTQMQIDKVKREKETQIQKLQNELQLKGEKLSEKEAENDNLKTLLKKYKKVIYGLAALCAAFSITLIVRGACSGGK